MAGKGFAPFPHGIRALSARQFSRFITESAGCSRYAALSLPSRALDTFL